MPSSRPHLRPILKKFLGFLGPGVMVLVAYFDPGNYSEAVSAGSQYQYKLLFAIGVLNVFAVILQCLCVKLGSVTGLDLAQMCRKELPWLVNLALYVLSELAIVATDLAEVVGTAIALEILFHIPLFWGVVATVVDVLVVLVFYRREGATMKQVRLFEMFVGALVLATCVCFVVELFKVDIPNQMDVWRGFLPSRELLDQQALYIGMGILGATVMPHLLFLGLALVQPRLREFDERHGRVVESAANTPEPDDVASTSYRPLLQALQYGLKYLYAELIILLFSIAVFINSAILIVAGATLYQKPDAEDADLMSIYRMLLEYILPAAGLVFALAMLFSGQSAGVVCTMAGQIVSEGFLEWLFPPWVRRLVTRMIAIVPCLVVVLFAGHKGIASMLNGSQVVLLLILPFVLAPLVYFTSSSRFMLVEDLSEELGEDRPLLVRKYRDYSNSRPLHWMAVVTWAVIAVLNLWLIGSFLMGNDVF